MNRKDLLLDLIRENNNDHFAHYCLALEYKKENRPADARAVLEALMIQAPDYLPLYYQLGRIIEDAGDLSAALTVYRKGQALAVAQHDLKTRSELEEAIWMLED
jgi:cytochrome c-type biogenesis protein CcmH/NrfG